MVAAQTSMDWLSALGLTRAGRPDGARPQWLRRRVGGPRSRRRPSRNAPRQLGLTITLPMSLRRATLAG
jgi:hypothetical protein